MLLNAFSLNMLPADFAAIVKADSDRWGPVIRATGFTINE